MKGKALRRAISSAILVLTATNLPADGNIIDTTQPEQDGMFVEPSLSELETSPQVLVPGEISDPELIEAFVNLADLVREGPLDQADIAAKRLVELAFAAKGGQSLEVAKALTGLAIVQQQSQQFAAAEVNYRSAIEIIEDAEDRLNGRLLNPLKGLAITQMESGRPDLAATTFTRAIHITHVNEGPHNPEQLELLQDLAEIHLRLGDLEAASDAQDTIHSIMVRIYDPESLEVIPTLLRRADWQHSAGMINAERATYHKVVNIVEKNLTNDDIAIVDPLVRLGKSYFYVDTSGQATLLRPELETAEIHLRRALRIATNNDAAHWRDVSNAALALGDFYMFDSNPRHAKQIYRDVWDILSEPDDSAQRLQYRKEKLESLTLLREQSLPTFVLGFERSSFADKEDPVLQGKISYRFTVSKKGRAADLTRIEATPEEFIEMRSAVADEIYRRIYRPPLVDGEPVMTPDQVVVHNFYYRQSDLTKAREAAAAAALEDEKR